MSSGSAASVSDAEESGRFTEWSPEDASEIDGQLVRAR
jgi:hypothetical protein